jgi:hypothetical protein
MSWVRAVPTSEREDRKIKLIVVLLVSLPLLAAGTLRQQSVSSSDASHVRGHSQTIIDPRIESFGLKGHRLLSPVVTSLTGQPYLSIMKQ